MKPIEFKEQNMVFAQPEYIPLPGHKVQDERGEFIFCMSLSFRERLKIFVTALVLVAYIQQASDTKFL